MRFKMLSGFTPLMNYIYYGVYVRANRLTDCWLLRDYANILNTPHVVRHKPPLWIFKTKYSKTMVAGPSLTL